MSETTTRYKDLPTLEGEEIEYQRRLNKSKYLNGATRKQLLDVINNPKEFKRLTSREAKHAHL